MLQQHTFFGALTKVSKCHLPPAHNPSTTLPHACPLLTELQLAMRLTVYPFADDTYMYDEALRHGPNATAMAAGAAGGIPGGAHYAVSALHHQGHWYDEPPYESDPDDFLMAGLNCGPAATIQVSAGRACVC